MEIQIDLLSDWVEFLRSEMAETGYYPSEDDSVRELAYKFFNIRRRRISPTPRLVHESSEISCPAEYQAGYDALKRKLISGRDVTPHLSKTILREGYEDGLLNDWGIHHFHLDGSVENGFTERTELLLFAYVTESAAYCINILPHESWAKQDLIKILHDEWPRPISRYRLDAVGLEQQLTDKEVAELRKAGVLTPVQVEEGVVYAPIGGGISTAGTSNQSGVQADHYLWRIGKIEEQVKENAEIYIRKIMEQGLSPGKPPNFKLLVDKEELHVLEIHSGFVLGPFLITR